jgi:nicotinamide-nucleotide amidase
MKVSVLSVGSELLAGDTLNSNATFLSKRLHHLGIEVVSHRVAGDNKENIMKSLKEELKGADILFITGGLGPTPDDLTKETVSEFFGRKLVLDPKSLQRIEDFFERLGMEIGEGNRKQAYFPEGSEILPNDIGTAPGCIVENKDKKVILLPGPPREMERMFEKRVLVYLDRYLEGFIETRTLRLLGIGEGHMAEKIRDLIRETSEISVAPYSKEGENIIQIVVRSKTREAALSKAEEIESEIRKRLGKHIYGEGETCIEAVVGNLLEKKGLKIAFAESCTGGMIASTMVNHPGISSTLLEGVVVYTNESKVSRLGVKEESIAQYGAVSEQVAREMAEGIVRTSKADVGISVTGIAGPSGGTPEKPVGTVFVGMALNGETRVKKLNLWGSRNQIRRRTMLIVLDWLRRSLMEI